MNETKIKEAFLKVKEDIGALDFKIKSGLEEAYLNLEELKKTVIELKEISKLNEDIKKQIHELKKLDIENFIQDMLRNFAFIKKVNEQITEKFDTFHSQFNDLREKINMFSELSKKNNEDIKNILVKLENTDKLINEKLNLEIANFKLEVYEELTKLRREVKNNNKKTIKTKKE